MKKIEGLNRQPGAPADPTICAKVDEIIEVVNELVDRSQSSYVKGDIGSPKTWQVRTRCRACRRRIRQGDHVFYDPGQRAVFCLKHGSKGSLNRIRTLMSRVRA